MTWDLNPSDLHTESPKGGDFNNVDVPGTYHCHVVDVDEADKLVIDMEVLGGADGSQLGKTLREWIQQNQPDQLHSFVVATGLVTQQEIMAAKAAGRSVPCHVADAKGRHLIVNCDWNTNPNTGKTSMKVTYKGFTHVADPAVAKFVNEQLLPGGGAGGNAPFDAPETDAPETTERNNVDDLL